MTPKIRTAAGSRAGFFAALVFSLTSSNAFDATGVAAAEAEPELPQMQAVRISDDGRNFVLAESGKAFVPWGFNYLGEFGKLMEDSWDKDWPRIERDFREMRKLGGNVVRVHLQFGTYMKGPDEFDQTQLDRHRKLLDLGRELGVYLDITGLSCYRLDRIPNWYEALDELERWEVQARWWKEIAKTCAGHSAVFCYDLMNEPIVGGMAKEGEPRWVGGELGGFYFVQRISEAPRGRTNIEIANDWASKLTKAIRQQDARKPITVGAIPWAQVWPNAKPLFYSPEVSKHFDFVTWLDGYDVVEAFAAQRWVDDIALGDQSWPGLTQLYVASTQPPSLDAIVAGSVVGDFYRDVFFPGGIPNVGFGHNWASGRDVENAWPSRRKEVNALVKTDLICAANQALRGENVSLLETIKKHPYDGVFWKSRSAAVANITVPTLQIVSWQDPQVGSRPAILSSQFPTETPVRLVGVNGFHQYWSGAVWDEIVQFLEVYLGDASPEVTARYESQNDFLALLESDDKGNVRGRFTLPQFADAGEGRRLVIGADLTPNEVDGSGSSSAFTYNPTPPGAWKAPVQDQVTFTSDALTRQTVMAGSGSVDLWIAADAKDVDLQVTLSEVRPDGHEMLVQSGWLRASHRALDENASTVLRPQHLHTAESLETLIPRKWTPLRIELFPFAHLFREGSMIRLMVSGPGAAANAWPWAFDSLPGGFDVRIAHDGKDHSSSIVLPIVKPADLSAPSSLPEHDRVWLQPSRPVD